MIFANVCSGRDNNLNLIRMVAASGVLVSHAYPIALGDSALQPFQESTGFTLGWICVAIFFAISGFLITRSLDRSRYLTDWFTARVMRLFPGLLVVSVLIAALYGPVFTVLSTSAYFSQAATYLYVPRNLSLLFLQYDLPGVFADHPYPEAINGSLWTLIYEVVCYGGVFLAGLIGALRSRRFFAVLLVAYLAVYLATRAPGIAALLHPKAMALASLSYPFAIGMAFYVWRDRIRLSYLLAAALAVLAALLKPTILFAPAFVLAISYATFVLGYRPAGVLRRYNDFGDFSYGTYIYAFPVQQAAIALAGPMTPLQNMAYAFPVTLVLAIASWRLVEEPSLDRRHAVAQWIRDALSRFGGPRRMTIAPRDGTEI